MRLHKFWKPEKIHGLLFLVVMLASGLLSVTSCRTTKSPGNVDRFVIGKGGGFTGKYEVFAVYSDGRIMKMNGEEGQESISKNLSAGETKELFKRFDALKLDEINFHHSGNMNYYLETDHDGKPHRVQWGVPGEAPPESLSVFFDHCWSLVR